MRFRLLFLLPVFFMATACQVFEQRHEPHDTRESEAHEDDDTLPTIPGRLTRAIEYLQEGQPERAENLLVEHLSAHPDNRVAILLLEQIRQDPAVLLGDRYQAVVVRSGDTLSQLAARHAGNGMLFYALARLNGIEQPRLLQPGTVLQVPAGDEAVMEPDEGPVQLAEDLLDGGEAEKALSMLLTAARSGDFDESGAAALQRSALRVSDTHLEAGRVDEAHAVLVEIEPWLAEVGADERLSHQYNRIDARRALEEARRAAAANDPESEYVLLRRAIELDSELSAAESALAKASMERVDHYHDQALKAWRDQDAQTAAEHWERVLEIDPDFEPARVYLERAHEVLRRLEEL